MACAIVVFRFLSMSRGGVSDCAAGVGLEGGCEDFHGFGEVFFFENIGHSDFVFAHSGGGVEA